MAEEEVGSLVVRVGLDGTGFQNGISAFNRELKVVQSEFSAAASKMGDFGSESEKLGLKAESLTKQIEVQEKKVGALREAHARVASEKGSDAKATQDLQVKLNQADAALGKMQNELKKTETDLRNLRSETDQQSTSLGRMKGEFTKAFTDAKTSIGGTFDQLKLVGAAATGAGAGIALGLGSAVSKAADFEQSMANVKAVMSPAEAQQFGKALEDLALKMGADTAYSATEAAKGIEELEKAGVSTEQILNGGLQGALSLASAGGIELGDAAEIASTALNAFKADNLSVSKAADVLAGAANASATSVQELKFGLSASASVASAVGMTFDDTSTALAVLAQNGLKGSDAGTSLKTMLMNLQPSTKEQVALFKQLGLSAADGSSKFYDANGHLKSMSDISDILQTSMKGMTDAQRLSAMETLFGSDAIRASNILYKEGADGIKKMKTAMGQVTAEQVAAEKMNTFRGTMEQLKGSFETAQISIGNAFLPVLKQLAGFIGHLTDAFNGLSPGMQTFIAVGAAVTAGLLLIAGPALILVGFLPSIAAGFATLVSLGPAVGAAFTIMTGPIGITIAAIAGLIAIGILVYKNWDEIKGFLIETWTAIKDLSSQVWTQISSFFSNMWSGMKDVTVNVWNSIADFFRSVWAQIIGIFQAVWSTLGPIVTAGWDSIKAITSATWDSIKAVLTAFWDAVKTLFAAAFLIIYDLCTGKWGEIGGVFSAARDNLSNIITGLWDAIKGIWTAAFEVVKQSTEAAWEQIKVIFKAAWDGITAVIKAMWDSFKKIFREAGNGLKDIIKAMWDGIVTLFTDSPAIVLQKLKDLGVAMVDAMKSVAKDFYDVGKNMIAGLIDGIGSMASAVVDKAKSVVSGAVNSAKSLLGINSPSRVFMEIGNFTGEGLAIGMENSFDKVKQAAGQMAGVAIPTGPIGHAGRSGNSISVLVTGNHLSGEADEDRLVDKLSRRLAGQYGLSVGGAF